MMLASTNTFGAPDLDLRPPEMLRSSMAYRIQECKNCGYCADDISEDMDDWLKDKVRELTRDPYYLYVWKEEERIKGLASQFRRQALILRLKGDHSAAGWANLHAAWACDDETMDHQGANICRMDAYRCFKHCKIFGLEFAERNGTEEVVMVDLLRRASEFEKANALCFEIFPYIEDETVRSIMEFERQLIWSSNCGCYNMSAVFGKEGSP